MKGDQSLASDNLIVTLMSMSVTFLRPSRPSTFSSVRRLFSPRRIPSWWDKGISSEDKNSIRRGHSLSEKILSDANNISWR